MDIYILNAFLALFLLMGYGAICVCLGFIAQLYHGRYIANKRKGDHNNGKV